MKAQDAPRNMPRFFLTFLRTASPRRVPREILAAAREIFGTGQFQSWEGQGIGAIIVDDTIRGFVPVELLRGVMANNPGENFRVRVGEPDPNEFKQWFTMEGRMLRPDQQLPFSFNRRKSIGY